MNGEGMMDDWHETSEYSEMNTLNRNVYDAIKISDEVHYNPDVNTRTNR